MQHKRFMAFCTCLLALSLQAFGQTTLTLTAEQTACELASPSGVRATIEIWGELTGESSLGIAGFAFDLSATKDSVAYDISGATVTAADSNFERPAGITNLAGFGGTASGLKLLQIGGAQNTISHTVTFPNASSITTNLGESGPALLATIVVTVGNDVNTGAAYVVTLENIKANVIEAELTEGYSTKVGCIAQETISVELLQCGSCSVGESCTDDLTSTACADLPRYVCDVSEADQDWPPCTGGGTSCFADPDCSGVVNAADYGYISANYLETDAEKTCHCDLDGSGVINPSDKGYISANLGLCTALPDYQNGSGLNGGAPDSRYFSFVAGGTCP